MSVDRELDAAAITDPGLRLAYQRCRALNAEHGRTYYLATRLLPRERRPAIHALYGFARCGRHHGTVRQPHARRRHSCHCGEAGGSLEDFSDDPVVAAVVDTARRYDIAPSHSRTSDLVRMDLTITSYGTTPTWRGTCSQQRQLRFSAVAGHPCRARSRAGGGGAGVPAANFLRDVGGTSTAADCTADRSGVVRRGPGAAAVGAPHGPPARIKRALALGRADAVDLPRHRASRYSRLVGRA
ncbi:hypothetical protein K7G98_08250 [Saccharothrix sp. MB29]|nr:hypothetical protein [Saccharothrix sp. MB29]